MVHADGTELLGLGGEESVAGLACIIRLGVDAGEGTRVIQGDPGAAYLGKKHLRN